MRFSRNPEKNTGIIWFVITIGSFLLMILFAAVFLPSGFTFGRFFPAVLLGCVSFLGMIFAPTFYWSGKKLDSLLAGKDLLARWSYRPEEIGSMLEDEKKRQKKLRVVVLFFVCLCLGMGVLFCYAWGRWDYVAVSEYVLLLMLTLVFMYAGLPAMGFDPANATDMYLGRNGVLFAGRFHIWGFWGAHLVSVNYLPGTPASVGIVYSHVSKEGPQVINISIPVPPGKEREAQDAVRALVSGATIDYKMERYPPLT
jgi:hypothetical protein